MALDRDDGLWGNFKDHFDEVMQVCEIPEANIEWLREWRDGKPSFIISEETGIEMAKVRDSIMIVFGRLRKHLGIAKSG